MNLLVIGGTGQVGLELQQLELPAGVRLYAPPRSVLDLRNSDDIETVLHSGRWDAAINCAAYTNVEKAESDKAEAWEINALGPARLAAATAAANVPLLHLSTDYVFDGAKDGFYEEDDPVAPLNVYGASKAAGEQAVRVAHHRHVILRTGWLVSPHRTNFLKTILRLSAQRPVLQVVDDQRGCPTRAGDLAQALVDVAVQVVKDASAPGGTYHFVNAGETTWYGFASEILRVSARYGASTAHLQPVTTAEFPTIARRPRNSRLSTAKIRRVFGVQPRPWQAALADVAEQLSSNAAASVGSEAT